jgi:hypothetical protein
MGATGEPKLFNVVGPKINGYVEGLGCACELVGRKAGGGTKLS